MPVFIELSIVIAVTLIVASIMRILKQPLVVAYIISGVIVGPHVLNFLQNTEYLDLFSKIGVATLLFIVGLSLNPIVVKEVGKVSLISGMGQVLFTAFIGFVITRGLGFDVVHSIYVAIALTFSSTIIILKLLSDMGDLGKLHGKISIGILLVQDLVATLILVGISAITVAGALGIGETAIYLLIKGITLSIVMIIISKYVLPRLGSFFASSSEFLFLFTISWGLGLAALFSYMGFSIEVGALIAGVTLAVSPFAYEAGSRMRPLRDFFLILFFVALGSHIVVTEIGALIVPAIILSLFVLIGNPLIVFIIMNLMGHRRRTSFLVGLTVAQISEFSLILAALAFSVGHITQEIVSLITLVGIVTIAGSTYLILYSDAIYSKISPILKFLEIRKKGFVHDNATMIENEILIFGYDRVGEDFLKAAKKLGSNYLVIDYNPISIKKLSEKSIPYRYGDAEDVEFLQELNLEQTKLVISTMPDFTSNMILVTTYKKFNPEGIILALSHDLGQTNELYKAGASFVIMPHYLGASYASELVSKFGFDHKEFSREREEHQKRLRNREGN
ncbi:MAG: cation:proton antiporter [bacterium]|nr:cation:proton antiporter [bacterium]